MSNDNYELTGGNLSIPDLVRIARSPEVTVSFGENARTRVALGWKQIERVIKRPQSTRPRIYGVTTGFGEFKNRSIPNPDLERLQENILLSHSTGVGYNVDRDDPSNYYSAEVVRAALVIRLNTFLRGHSGVRPQLLDLIQWMINRGVIPLVPLHGSVGSSGDLCPLSHLFAVLLDRGRYYIVAPGETHFPGKENVKEAATLSEEIPLLKQLAPPLSDGVGKATKVKPEDRRITYKEGLALTNGASFSAAMLALAVYDGELTANAADLALALSLEAICGCARAFDEKVHRERHHQGQIDSAANVRVFLKGSLFIDSCAEVQDAYSFRCGPAVHGASRDVLTYAAAVVEREINAATDNPLFFPGKGKEQHSSDPWDVSFADNWRKRGKGYDGRKQPSYSAGNFHGQPLGLAADFLAIALAELANISERRIQTLLDSHHNRGLPANLIPMRGTNSGFMIAQYCAASLVSENKVLAHPASVDSIPTSANSEDHVSMATIAARKLRTVLANTQAVLSIELMVGAQAVEWRALTPELVKTPGNVRKPEKAEAALFRGKTEQEDRGWVTRNLGDGTAEAYRIVREKAGVQTLVRDSMLDEPIRKIREWVANGNLVRQVGDILAHKDASVRTLIPLTADYP